MPVTRTQTGKTPKYVDPDTGQIKHPGHKCSKPYCCLLCRQDGGLTFKGRKPPNPGFVETPGPFRRRRIGAAQDTEDSEIKLDDSIDLDASEYKPSPDHANGTTANGTTPNGSPSNETTGTVRKRGRPRKHQKVEEALKEAEVTIDPKIDQDPIIDFGGSWGVTALMIGFPLLMWYMWIGATYYDGKLPLPAPGQTRTEFLFTLVDLVYVGAFPTAHAWLLYWGFFVMEALFYLYLPGVYSYGKPLPHEGGNKLKYYCSGVWSFYTTIVITIAANYFGIFRLSTIIDEFGPLLSVSIISGFLVSFIAYFSALYRGAQHRMTGYPVYDFFMGAELNPRMFEWLDFKMFFEVRLPWFILFLISLSAAARQWEQYGYVSGEVGFLLMAHWLYANACCKGEELICTTWDMYYEKWGFMLIFWNLAGVPFSYCHCTIYLANHDPAAYRWSKPALVVLYVSYLFVYWVWDTAGSQKNMFRASERGTRQDRKTFPQLPWKEVKDPVYIETDTGDSILCSGWYGYARKIHYTCDTFFALTWGLVTDFKSPFPWFYPVFFTCMIIHRAWRDIQRCRLKYGEHWTEYEKKVPYIFVPVSDSINYNNWREYKLHIYISDEHAYFWCGIHLNAELTGS